MCVASPVTDTDTWNAILGYTWPERVRMLYLRDHNPALYPGPYDQADEFRLVDPAVAAALAGPVVEVTWLGISDADDPVAAG